ncbi:MAG: DedA family protein [bacterium]|nr:DedA family protein [bacterium]
MNFFISLIYEYGLIAMFFLILLEYACFPVSSEIVLPFSGAVASIQHVSFLVIILVSVAAGLLGTSICYGIGRYGGVPLIEKIKRKFPSTEHGLDSSFEKFNKYGHIAVCIGRVIPICRTYIAFIAGAVKQPYGLFLTSSGIGITVWNIILIGLGYTLRENWTMVGTYYEEYKIIIMPVLIIGVALLLIKLTPLKKLFLRDDKETEE